MLKSPRVVSVYKTDDQVDQGAISQCGSRRHSVSVSFSSHQRLLHHYHLLRDVAVVIERCHYCAVNVLITQHQTLSISARFSTSFVFCVIFPSSLAADQSIGQHIIHCSPLTDDAASGRGVRPSRRRQGKNKLMSF